VVVVGSTKQKSWVGRGMQHLYGKVELERWIEVVVD
jgi:hypothetical protein